MMITIAMNFDFWAWPEFLFFLREEKKYEKILYETITHHAGHTFMSNKYKK